MPLEARLRKELSNFQLDISFSCPAGELLTLAGPSGSGKTTIIRILAGLDTPDSGSIQLASRTLYDSRKKIRLNTQSRKLGYVFQEASLFPHLSVSQNVAFGCKTPSLVPALLDLMEIPQLADRKPARISGGERQRAALAQALASEPELLLLDEPFSALDIKTRHSLQQKILRIKEQLNIPIILVTHDLQEAAVLSDRIVAMEEGKRSDGWLKRFDGTVLPVSDRNAADHLTAIKQLPGDLSSTA